MTRRRRAPVIPRREREYAPLTPEQEAVMATIRSRARSRHPDRFAPDGTALLAFPGRTWSERLAAWSAQTGIPSDPTPDLDSPYTRIREGGPR